MSRPDQSAPDGHSIGFPDPQIDRASIVRSLGHDIRQPQSALTNALTALASQLTQREQLLLVHTASAAHREQTWIVQQLLDFLRVLVPELRPMQKIVSLQTLLEDMRSAYDRLAKERGIQITVSPTPMMVISDPQYLHRVMNNLVTNAITHSSATRLLLCARREGTGCVIEVRDNGSGIRCIHVEDMFQPGWRGEPAPGTEKVPGSGLGLFIVRANVRALEGRLEVKTTPGRGTVFRVSLPGPITHARAIYQWPKTQAGSLAGRVVAILDDQRPVVDSMRVLFENLGALVVAADNDLDLISEVSKLPRPPDLFILDFMLGTSTLATRCLAILRQRLGHENVRAIILTGNPSHPELKNVPNVPIIEKPLSETHFRKIVALLSGEAQWDPSAIV